MNLNGLTSTSLKVFEAIKKSDLLQEYSRAIIKQEYGMANYKKV
jgi:hypothetical protein